MSNIAELCALFFTVFLVGTHAAEEVNLPNGIKLCNHTSSDYSSCLKNALQESWPIIVKGIPELGLPSLDPLEFGTLEYVFKIPLVFSTRLDVRNVTTYGVSNATFGAVRPTRSVDRMSLDIDFYLPKTFADGYYKAQGRAGLIKLGGKGYFNQTSEGVRATWRIDGRIENDRWVVEYSGIKNPLAIRVRKLKFYFDDLFNGNKLLNEAALIFINKFWQVLYLTMLPIVWKRFIAQSTEFTNQFFSKLSFAKTFP